MSPTLKTAASALTFACAASAALASEPRPAVAVRYGDLNTNAPAGAQVLLQRIDQATVTLCGGRPDLKAVADFQRFKTCRAEARARAVAEFGQPLLATMANHPAGR